jgi:drug/metabolite transporter (DMT)-like permease
VLLDYRVRSGFLLAAGAALLYGANQPASAVLINGPLGPRYMVESRLVALAVGFGAVACVRHRNQLRLTPREAVTLAGFGLAGLAVMQWALTEAIARIAVGIVVVCVYCGAFLVAIWCRIVRREPTPPSVWVAITIGIGGLVLAVGVGGATARSLTGAGLAFAALAACAFAYYALHADILLRRRPAAVVLGAGALVAATAWCVFAAPVARFPLSAIRHRDVTLGAVALPAWVVLAASLTLGTVLPYLMVLASIARIGPTPTSVAGMIEPVVAVLLSWVWLAQQLTVLQVLGGVVVIGSVVLVQHGRSRALA